VPASVPDELSERIAGEATMGRNRPNAIFVTDTSDEPNIVWSSSATFVGAGERLTPLRR
jgi:hypothetical protein